MEKNNLLTSSFSLKESTAQMQDFFMQSSMALAIMEGPEHFFSQANPQYEKLVGRKVVGKKVSDIFTDEELGPYLNLVKEVFRTGTPWVGKEQPFTIPDAKGIIQENRLDIAYYPMKNDQGHITGVLAVVEDITQQFITKKIINENANVMPHFFWSAKSDGFIDWYDDKFYFYTGMNQGTLWNESGSPLHVDDLELITRLWSESIDTGEIFEVNLRLKSKADGEYHWFLSRAVPVKNELGVITRWIGSLTDVHENKNVQSQLEIQRDMREQFVATLSHDLLFPMFAVRLYLELIMRSLGKPELLKGYSQEIIKSIDQADQMILDLLDANRINAGETLPMTVENCDLTQIAMELVEALRNNHGDRFKINTPSKLNGLWSKSGFQRILQNLVSNAIKYGDEKLPITITLSKKEQLVMIEVHNWGKPISISDQKTLYNQYHRSAAADSSQQRGWGLGLTIVKGLAQAHQGHVSVASSLEFGTTFTVTLIEKQI